jgi:transposase
MRRNTRSYRIRSYPNGAQRRLRDRWFGAYRWLWNTALEICTEAYRQCGLTLTGNDISRWLTQWKRTEGHEWLMSVPATCLTQCLRDQGSAFRNYFAGRAQYPKLKRKDSAGSLRFQDAGTGWQRGILSLPKLGVLKLAESLPSVDRPDLVTLTIEMDRWYASSKTCSNCRHVLDELRLDVRYWTCPKCKARHDQDINAARNLLAEGLRQLAARDERDLCVDAGYACPEEILVQVLAEGDGVQFTRSGQCNRACREQARLN